MATRRRTYRRGMALTVGTGTRPDSDIVAPLIKSIRDANPDVAMLVTTDASSPHAADLQRRFGRPHPRWEEQRLASPDEIGAAFRGCLNALRRVMALGVQAEDLTVDYTTGTKTMTTALGLAAVALRCGALRYITGERVHGVVVAGTERFMSTPPTAVLAVTELQRAEDLIHALQFRQAAELCRQANDILLEKADCERREALIVASEAYEAWDRFRHHEAKKKLERLAALQNVPADLRVQEELPSRLHKVGDAVYRGRCTPDLVADLVANSERRLIEGRWDDAVARLYRATEMLAQMVLRQRHNVDTGDLQPDQLPDTARTALFSTPGSAEEHVIGLERAYRLLEVLGEPLGERFRAAETGVWPLLQARNQSILAHGTKPVDAREAASFFRRVVALAETEVPRFASQVEALQFPWIQRSILPE